MPKKLAGLLSAAGMIVTLACSQSDIGITTNLKSKLAADDAVGAYRIDVHTSNRVVTLTGSVDSVAAKEQAVAIARNTDGVVNVVDSLVISQQPTATTGDLSNDARELGRDIRRGGRDVGEAAKEGGREAQQKVGQAAETAARAVNDAALTSTVKSKLLADSQVSGMKIDVDTDEGVVTLEGTVASEAEKDRAVSVARDTQGVKRVVNNLRIGR